jgi:ketosteroid isomerase-like protein
MFEPTAEAAHPNPNVAALQQAYRRWSDTRGGSAPEVLELFADEIEMRSVLDSGVPGELGGTHRSRAEAADYFAALSRDWEMLYYEVERFIAEGGRFRGSERAAAQPGRSPESERRREPRRSTRRPVSGKASCVPNRHGRPA